MILSGCGSASLPRISLLVQVYIPHVDTQAAYDKYVNVHQGSDETLLRFKERFGDAVTAMEAFALGIPSQVMQVRQFMERLDRAHYYAGIQAHVVNLKSLSKIDPPAALIAAYNAASQLQVVLTKNTMYEDQVITQLVMVASGKTTNGSREGRGDSRGSRAHGGRSAATSGD